MSCCLDSPAKSLPSSPLPQVNYHQNQFVRQTPRNQVPAQNAQPAPSPDQSFVPPNAAPSFSRERPLPPGCQRFAFNELREATGNFSEDAWLGEGGFGKVYRGTLYDKSSVAIKRLDRKGLQGDREFEVEINVLARLRHHNLVTLRGACTEGKNRMAVFDFMPGGSLRDNLDRRRQSISSWQAPRTNLLWPSRIEIALGAAKGLRFLHEGIEPGMIHRDVKSSNVLLDGQGRARISDFGLAIHTGDKSGKEAATYQTPPREDNDDILTGTYGYTAPETCESGVMSQKSDVYAFGVVLLELLTGLEPIDTSRNPHSLVELLFPILTKDYPDVDQLMKHIDPVIPRESVPVPQLMWFCEVAAGCLQHSPKDRLRMSDVVACLSKLDAWKETPIETTPSGRRLSTSDRTENGKYTLRSLMDDLPISVPPVNEEKDLFPTVSLLPHQIPEGAHVQYPQGLPSMEHDQPNPQGYPMTPVLPHGTLNTHPNLPSQTSPHLWPLMEAKPQTPPESFQNSPEATQDHVPHLRNIGPNNTAESPDPLTERDYQAWHQSLGIDPQIEIQNLDTAYSPLRSSITGIGKVSGGRHNMEAYSDQAHLSQHRSMPVGPLQDGVGKMFTPQNDVTAARVLFAKDFVESQPRQGSPSWVSFDGA